MYDYIYIYILLLGCFAASVLNDPTSFMTATVLTPPCLLLLLHYSRA